MWSRSWMCASSRSARASIPQEPNQRWSLDFISDALEDGRSKRRVGSPAHHPHQSRTLADPQGDDRPLSGALYLSAPNTPTAARDPTNRLPLGVRQDRRASGAAQACRTRSRSGFALIPRGVNGVALHKSAGWAALPSEPPSPAQTFRHR